MHTSTYTPPRLSSNRNASIGPGKTKTRLSAFLTLTFLLLFTIPARPATILFVVRDRQTTTPGIQMNSWDDPPYLDRLTNVLGHNVILMGSSLDQLSTTNDWQTNGLIDLVLISGSVSAAHIGSAYRQCNVPLIASENSILDDDALGEGYNAGGNESTAWGELSGNTTLVITDPTHPMAGGFSGTVTVYSNSSPGRFNYVLPNPHLTAVAIQAGFTNRAVICGYEEGAPMFGLTAPARRVSLFLPETDTTNATPAAWALFDATIAWALNGSKGPKVTNLAPGNGAVFVSAGAGMSFKVNSSQAINTSDIHLTLNGFDETPNLVITGSPTDRTVTFSGLLSNKFYNAEITVSNTLGSRIQRLRFDTFREADAMMIEAEDYNYSSGQFQNDPVPSAYANQSASPDIDFFDTSPYPSQPSLEFVYRPSDNVGTRTVDWLNHNDFLRTKFVSAGVPDYYVRFLHAGDWMNYTRDFASNSYHAYLRADTITNLQMNLDQVTSDPAQSGQTTASIGIFDIQDSANGGFRYAPLKDASGGPVTVNLSGTNTLRLTDTNADPAYHPGLGLNYLLLLPAAVDSMAAPPLILNPHREGNNFVFSFATSAGRRYSVEAKATITEPAWSTITSFNGDGLSHSITNSATGGNRFFRVGVY